MRGAIRLLLADDHPVVRAGLRAELAEVGDLLIVGEATNGDETLRLCEQLQPDVLLLDLNMPSFRPLDAVQLLAKLCPETRIIVLTVHDDDVYVRTLVAAGVSGYLLKMEGVEAVVSAIHGVMQGGTWFSRAVMDKVASTRARNSSMLLASLTGREREILERIARGWGTVAIAEDLHLAEQTVRNYISRLYSKLDLHSRAEAVIWAREHHFGTGRGSRE